MDYETAREEKRILNNKICELRKRLGLRSGTNLQNKLPPHIVKDPLFKRYKRFCQEIRELDVLISEIPKEDRREKTFPVRFTNKVQEKYPDIFDEITKDICGEDDDN